MLYPKQLKIGPASFAGKSIPDAVDLPAGTGRQNFHHIKTDVGICRRALLKILACRGKQTLLFIIVHRFGRGGALGTGTGLDLGKHDGVCLI